MSQSNVGDRAVYEAGDQRNYKASEIPGRPDYEQGKENSHQPNDSSISFQILECISWTSKLTFVSEDQRSIANRLANEEVWPPIPLSVLSYFEPEAYIY